ncbi:hypothetical protein EMIHUDRAFT_247068 [Emiliania huxleyi CCMP1516]|uniref:RING-type domain-containing protein n=2 Tax=Emiliania huxleyi TaxID=2903 RepID=A0A0D3IPS9_EMIH1|nr:hypothetical protein EMIHUDRAFT_247068 [Emiliania huxleyi CCMP1516]EOD13264.1 hypothetical protein EMIHUDRAFT_247068 [Emiliania huxleyi CCMP1516]|eukprot:XP_005765693.1 hypothetical protein EMIHUDRAFT_247068 [Emiliania huxleyi CCMP1516]
MAASSAPHPSELCIQCSIPIEFDEDEFLVDMCVACDRVRHRRLSAERRRSSDACSPDSVMAAGFEGLSVEAKSAATGQTVEFAPPKTTFVFGAEPTAQRPPVPTQWQLRVSGLHPDVSAMQVRAKFSPFGELLQEAETVKQPISRGAWKPKRLTVREQLALLLALQPSLKLLTETPTAEEARNTACVFSESRSQFREDLLMLPMLLHVADNKPGTFVELGAFDGVDSSNSIMLERCFGWTGLLIEANPSTYAKLLHSGRKARMINSAICDADANEGQTVRMLTNGGSVASLRQFQNEFTAWRWHAKWNTTVRHETAAIPDCYVCYVCLQPGGITNICACSSAAYPGGSAIHLACQQTLIDLHYEQPPYLRAGRPSCTICKAPWTNVVVKKQPPVLFKPDLPRVALAVCAAVCLIIIGFGLLAGGLALVIKVHPDTQSMRNNEDADTVALFELHVLRANARLPSSALPC